MRTNAMRCSPRSKRRAEPDSSSAGASYVDVRLPERPAAGFPGGVVPADGSDEPEAAGTSSGGAESSEALAEGLTKAVGGGAAASTPTGVQPGPGEAEEEKPAPSAPSSEEASSEAPSETGG